MNDAEAFQRCLTTIVATALQEDIGEGDVTTQCLVEPSLPADGKVIAKRRLVTAGYAAFKTVYTQLSGEITCRFCADEGSCLQPGDCIAELTGPYRTLLTGERTALNFMQRLSGIATLTRTFVERTAPFGTVILDTRKTTPGLRLLEKEAVRIGGAQNHRMGLYDAILIKDNHIALCGSVTDAVQKAKKSTGGSMKIEVEVASLDQLHQAVAAGPDIIMLDNMSIDQIKEAVREVNGRVPIEASGNISLENVEAIAAAGVDYISVGALTHSAQVADITMLLHPKK